MIKEFELTDEEMDSITAAARPVMYLVAGGRPPTSPHESVNNQWKALGVKHKFVWDTAKPIEGKGPKHFTAEVLDEPRDKVQS